MYFLTVARRLGRLVWSEVLREPRPDAIEYPLFPHKVLGEPTKVFLCQCHHLGTFWRLPRSQPVRVDVPAKLQILYLASVLGEECPTVAQHSFLKRLQGSSAGFQLDPSYQNSR